MWTYAPSDVQASVLGIPLEGFAKDNFIAVKRDVAQTTYKSAMDGTVAITNKTKPTYQIKFMLAQSSPSNIFLDTLKEIFNTYGNAIPLPILIRDKSGSATFFAADTWFEEEPMFEFGAEIKDRSWTLRCNSSVVNFGANGNSTITDILTTINAALQLANLASVNLNSITSGMQTIFENGDNILKDIVG